MKHNGWKWGLKVIAAGIAAGCVLSLFCMLYYNPPVHTESPTGATAYVREPDQRWSRLTEGVAHGRIDSQGFNNAFPHDPDQPVNALMLGSSQTEGLYIDEDKNACYLLNKTFAISDDPVYVYNAGMSAHDLYQTIQYLDTALATYQPDTYLFLETSILAADPDLMEAALRKELPVPEAVESGSLTHIIQKNPFIKQAYQQLNNYQLSKEADSSADKPATSDNAEDSDYDKMSDLQYDTFVWGDPYYTIDCIYLDYVSSLCSQYGCQPVVYYIPTMTLDDEGQLVPSADPDTRGFYYSICAQRGILFADMTDAVIDAYENDHQMASGFVNTTIGYGHLNEDGHRILTDTILQTLLEEEVSQ